MKPHLRTAGNAAERQPVRTDILAHGPGAPRVLLVGDHFGYPGGVAHGVTSYHLNVLPMLAAAGVSFLACFLRSSHPLARQLTDAGIELKFLNSGKWSPSVVGRVLKIARKYRPDVVHTIGMKSCVIGRIAARATKAAAIIHVHDLMVPPLILRLLYHTVAHPSDVGMSVSSAVAAQVPASYRISAMRNVVLHNGIDRRPFQIGDSEAAANRRRLLQLGPDSPVVGMVARFHPDKGHPEMFEIFLRVSRALPQARLALVGDGPTLPESKAMVAAMGLSDRVLFLGQRSDVPQLMSCFDLVAVPSRTEGLGFAAIEAFAAARPVVAFGVDGLVDIIRDREDGYLISPGDVEGFASAVVSLLNDSTQRGDFGARGAERSRYFDVAEHVRRLVGVYCHLADPRHRFGAFRIEEAPVR